MSAPTLTRNYNRREQPKCFHKVGGTTIDLVNPPPPKKGKEMVRAIYPEGAKNLIIPSRKPVEVPKLFKKSEYDRLKSQAHVVTAAVRNAMVEEANEKKRQKEKESAIRKENLQKAQKEQQMKEGKKLTLLENEAKKKTFYLLKRAFDLRQEQEDEVKQANQMILASKCLAIRAAQVVEKELIKKELDEEERRLDSMMEEQRRISLQEEEEQRKRDRVKKQRFVNEMMQQIREKEIEKMQEGERIEEEARMQNRALIQMQRDEEEKRQKKLKEQEKMRADLARANTEIARYKQIEKEEQRIADLRVQEFMRKKAEREAAIEEELRQAKIAKEKEIARLRALQEKQADQQAARDEMNALRVQEEVEREWRKKEKAAAEKKRQDEENLKIARQRQIEDIRRQQAVELQREKRDFFKVVGVQKALQQKDIEKEKKRMEENMKHRREILLQVNEKERDKINQKKEKFEEGVAIRAEQEIRKRFIIQALKSKMEKLRVNKVPETVVKDIERQLKLTK